jgi:hypothetical protein
MRKLNTKFKISDMLHNRIRWLYKFSTEFPIEYWIKKYPNITLKEYGEYRKFAGNLYEFIYDIEEHDEVKQEEIYKRRLIFFLQKHYGTKHWKMLGYKIYTPLYDILEQSGVFI